MEELQLFNSVADFDKKKVDLNQQTHKYVGLMWGTYLYANSIRQD